MANGIIIIDKPAGWTSMDVCAKLRGIFHEKRIGHAGTLDPMATGVLPVFVGKATKAVSFAEAGEKEYVAGLRLGLTTNTQDTTGETLTSCEQNVTETELLQAMQNFLGPQQQIPPMYSAVKIGGKKLYELARAGQEVERKPRTITIHELELLGREGEDWLLRVRCSKGTYIRTLCHDMGAALGCGGCMASLRRTMAAGFRLEQAVTLEALLELAKEGEPSAQLLPVDALFSQHPPVIVTLAQGEKIRHGAAVKDWRIPDGTCRVYAETGEFLMLGQAKDGILTSIKNFFEV